MIKTRAESAEVLYPDESIIYVSAHDIDGLKRLSLLNPRRRIRFCAHSTPEDKLQEMFIVHMRGCYVRPHKHLDKVEALAVIEGEADAVLFNDDGSIRDVISMGPAGSGKAFYQRLSQPLYHTLLILSDFFVFHEVTEGPFLREKTVFPDWAPVGESEESSRYISEIEQQVIIWRRENEK